MQEVEDPMDLEMQLLSTQQADNHGGGSGTKQIIHAAILVVRSVQMFLEGISDGSPPVSRVCSSKSIDSNPEHDEKVGCEGTEEIAIEFVNEDQAAPLLNTVDDPLYPWKQLRKLAHVLRSILAFKAHAASVASADHVHHDSSSATEGEPEVAEPSDSSAASSEHHIAIDQPMIKNISKIVRQKNLEKLQELGGLGRVKNALGTDLEKGISEEEAFHRQNELFLNLAPIHPFFHLVWKEVKKKTVLLIFLALALSIVFQIDEGLHDIWIYGVVILVAIVLQVIFASIHKYRKEQKARKKLQKQKLKEDSVRELRVIRGGETKDVSESELVYGDLLLLKEDCQVPADGLFVEGEDLELDYESESYIINEHKPFLSYGDRVIKGDARMVVISTKMMMIKATCDPYARFNLSAHLDKLNICMHYIRIIISVLIVLVLFLRYLAGAVDDEDVYKPESMAEPSGIKSFSNTFGKIIKDSKYTTKGLMKLLSVCLLGLTEGVAFVVSIAIVYWNEETLSDRATEQDLHVILNMASVTKICTDIFGELSEEDTEVQELFIGGELISEGRTLSPNVVEALCDGIGTSKENAYLHGDTYKLGLNRERMERILDLSGPVNEIISKCTHYYNTKGEQVSMNDKVRGDFGQANYEMEAEHDLTTIAVACKHAGTQTQSAEDWILVALLGLKNKSKEITISEVKACIESGVDITIVSRKKLQVLKDFALQNGLITSDAPQHSVLTGEDFRNCKDQERREIVDKIRVLGEAFSSDKLLLVETLKELGNVVVFLGQRTDEAPALVGADIGIAMGRQSSDKAKECSDIIIWDGSFPEIISMVHSGKCIYLNIQSFLQPVLIMTISSILISFIQTAAWGDASLTIVQFLWVNFAVLFLGGPALLTKALEEEPVMFGRSLITVHMTRNILVQVLYQVTFLVVIQAKGSGFVGSSQYMKTVVSNAFIICQFFNLFNAREPQKKNFFRGIHRHITFWVSITAYMVLHATFVAVQDIFGYDSKLNWKLWAGCVLVGVLSWVVDWLVKCISLFIMKFANRFPNTLH